MKWFPSSTLFWLCIQSKIINAEGKDLLWLYLSYLSNDLKPTLALQHLNSSWRQNNWRNLQKRLERIEEDCERTKHENFLCVLQTFFFLFLFIYFRTCSKISPYSVSLLERNLLHYFISHLTFQHLSFFWFVK
jgi:hypothetical protein